MTRTPLRATEVTIRGVTKTYRGAVKPAVDHVDLTPAPGTLTALVGPSGCGKTTLLKLLVGLLQPDSGDICLDGRSVLGVPAERRHAAMVFQKPLLFPHLSVGENIAFSLRVAGAGRSETRGRVSEMLDLVALEGLAGRRVDQLSGGQEQRVALARALIAQPAVLALDEPLSQLDAGLRAEMRDLIRGIQRQLDVTTVFVTHDQHEAVAVADTVALMLDGRIVGHDQPRAFYEHPTSVAAARFFGAANLLAGSARRGTFDAGFGPLTVAPGTADGPGVLIIRQEAIRIVDSAAAGNSRQGQVVAARYLGSQLNVEIDVGGHRLQLAAAPTADITTGQRITIELPADACTVVASPNEPPDNGRQPPSATPTGDRHMR